MVKVWRTLQLAVPSTAGETELGESGISIYADTLMWGQNGVPTPLNMDKRELRLDEYPLLIDGVCLSLSRTQSFGHVPKNGSLRVPSLCECKCGRCRAAARAKGKSTPDTVNGMI